jgi:RNase P subunit RPR2
MALSGRSSLERTNGRPLCPQCRAPMWSVRFPPEKAADDKITFQCPRCEHSHDVCVSSVITNNTLTASRD